MIRTRVEILNSNNNEVLQFKINKFLEKDGIICNDIKYNMTRDGGYYAMLIYYEFIEPVVESGKLKSTRFEAIDFAFNNHPQVIKDDGIYYVMINHCRVDLFKWYTEMTNDQVDLNK